MILYHHDHFQIQRNHFHQIQNLNLNLPNQQQCNILMIIQYNHYYPYLIHLNQFNHYFHHLFNTYNIQNSILYDLNHLILKKTFLFLRKYSLLLSFLLHFLRLFYSIEPNIFNIPTSNYSQNLYFYLCLLKILLK